jgi:hypothetical protein
MVEKHCFIFSRPKLIIYICDNQFFEMVGRVELTWRQSRYPLPHVLKTNNSHYLVSIGP